jgi:uncharacterized 2Fe-2S/4Fe-4S cluster protein (DUF4445 family)
MAQCKVTFLPAGVTVEVPSGTLLHEAAAQAGVEVALPCGAQGRCGRCKVKIEKGKVDRRDSSRLSQEQIEEGWVLSCVARVKGDATVTVPPKRVKEKAIGETVADKVALPLAFEWPLDPMVQRLLVGMDPPTLENNISDLERLRLALSSQHGIENVAVGLPVMRGLAQTLRAGNWRVAVVLDKCLSGPCPRLVDLRPAEPSTPLYGIAVDIGTTTVVVYLVDLERGTVRDIVSAFNGQSSYGEDVISRIVYAQRGTGLETLRQAVLKTINGLIAQIEERNGISRLDIFDMVASGNTTMIHLFLGLYPRYIREEPYIPTGIHFPSFMAEQVGVDINPNASVYCMPGVAAYVGGDITAGILSSGLYKTDKLSLFMDVGTNGEIVLGNADWTMTCACSAGPAFEGAGVQCGMRATTGAIEDVRIDSRTLEPTVTVIDDAAPLGVCGSGMISALAEMFITGIVDKGGRINLDHPNQPQGKASRLRVGEHGPEYVLVWAADSGTQQDIVITGVDIDNLIRTKAAIYAGIAVMLRNLNIELDAVEQVLIGGAFGQHINIEEAIQIGLLPDLPWERFKFLGNTSAQGAYHALLSREARAKADEIAQRLTYLELIADNTFTDEFTSALFLPHTNVDAFPSVKALLS